MHTIDTADDFAAAIRVTLPGVADSGARRKLISAARAFDAGRSQADTLVDAVELAMGQIAFTAAGRDAVRSALLSSVRSADGKRTCEGDIVDVQGEGLRGVVIGVEEIDGVDHVLVLYAGTERAARVPASRVTHPRPI